MLNYAITQIVLKIPKNSCIKLKKHGKETKFGRTHKAQLAARGRRSNLQLLAQKQTGMESAQTPKK